MFNTMKKITLAATVSTVAFASIAAANDTPEISMIDVTASYDAAVDSNAQELFPGIATDIKLAIADMVPQSDDAADPIVRVDIRKVALDGDTIIPDSAEFNEIEGVVSIETEAGNGGQSFPVNVVAETAAGIVPQGYTVVAPSDADFYNAMVYAFAQTVAKEVNDLNTEGGTISR